MERKVCLATVLLLAAALAASGQPAGERDASALRSAPGNIRPRTTFDFVIQKAEVRELSSSHLFVPETPGYTYGPPGAPNGLPSTQAAAQASPPLASLEADRLQKKQPSAKGKPATKPREEDPRKRIIGLSTPLIGQGPTSGRLVQEGYTYDKPSLGLNGQQPGWQPYNPMATYAPYSVPMDYRPRVPTPHKNVASDLGSNSIGSVEDSKQGEIPSLLGLDASNRSQKGLNERQGKSMGNGLQADRVTDGNLENGVGVPNKSPARGTLNEGEDTDDSEVIEARQEQHNRDEQHTGYVLPRPANAFMDGEAEEVAVEAARIAGEHILKENAKSAQMSLAGDRSRTDVEKSGHVLVRPSSTLNTVDAKQGDVLIDPDVSLKEAENVEALVKVAKADAAEAVGAGVGSAAGARDAVSSAKAAIASEAARLAAGELVAGPGVGVPQGSRLVTHVALRRRGGVAIAGPGGTAAAGAGGVAVVGPGGVAFARPNALSVVGPGGRVVALPAGAPEPRAGEALPLGARVVAVGPTVYLHPADTPALHSAPAASHLSFYKSPNWGFLAAAPPPPPPPLPALANLYTIINGRSVTPHSYINALHQNLLNLHFTKPLASAKTSVLSPAKFLEFQPPQQVFPWNYQLLRTPIAEPYQFPTNRPPPAVTAEATTTTTRAPPPTPTPSPEGSAEEVTGGGASSTEDTGSGTTPAPTPAPPAENKPTLLILKPFAKAVAGINGTAVATPVGHAIYHKGQPVDVVFDPRAVAVAGPGGNARAHSDLIVSYVEEEKPEARAELTELQYFGAARGRRPVLAWQVSKDDGDGGSNGDAENEEQGGGGGGSGGAGGGAGGGGGGGGNPADSVVVNQPPPGASVAEARPVGLSIAGAGGVAASKPQATAVVGPGGLAVARPVATAIAGVPAGALLGGGAGGGAGDRSAQRYDAAAASTRQHQHMVAVGPGPAAAKYSVLPAGAAVDVRHSAPAPADALVYVPVYVI